MNKVKKVLLIALVFLSISLSLIAVPFHIYADTDYESVDYDDVLEGYYKTTSISNTAMITWVFKESIFGSFQPTIKYKIGTSNTTNTLAPTIYVNGTTAQYVFSTDDNINITSITISSDMLYRYLYDDVTQYYFPYESLNFIVETAGRGYTQQELYNLGRWTIPIFEVPANGEITHKYLYAEGDNDRMTIILWVNKSASSGSSFENYFSITNGELVSLTQLNVFAYNGTSGTRLIKIVIRNNTNSTSNVYLYADVKMLIMPIYAKANREIGYESQDFCDNFGLQYGGSSAETSVDNADDTVDSLNDIGSDIFDFEDMMGENLDDSLEDINVNFDPGTSFGSKFLASSSWVRTQFGNLTNNTPFGSILSFSLLVGISLLIIGKVFK